MKMSKAFKNYFALMIFVISSGIASLGYAAVKEKDKNVKESNKKTASKESATKVDSIKHRLNADEVQEIKDKAAELKKVWSIRSVMPLTLSTTKRFERSQKLLTLGNYGRALDILEPVIERESSNDYERARALVLKAQILMTMKDYAAAEVSTNQALKLNSLSYSEQTEALLMLAQVQMIAKNYKEAKKSLVTFVEVADDKAASAYIMLATIENDLGDIDEAKKNIDLALEATDKPQEPWLYFASSIYVRTKDFDKAEKILKQLIDMRQSNKNYWMSLVGVLFEKEKFTEALQYLEMANKLGFVSGVTDVTNRAAMLSQERIPYKAALVLQKAIDSKEIEPTQKIYEFMASFWFVAKEYNKSIEAYKKASALADSGKVELLLGQVYLEQEDWANAQKAFQTALKKGNLKKQTGSAILGLGMTAYYQEDRDGALKYFTQAQKFKQQREAADNWISFLN